MSIITTLLFLSLSFAALAEAYPLSLAVGGVANLMESELASPYRLRKSTTYAPTAGIRISTAEKLLQLRVGIFADFKSTSIQRQDLSIFDNDFTANAYYAVIPVVLKVNHSADFYSTLGLAPHVLVAKSCNNDSIVPQGCGDFGDPPTFVNYATAGFGFSLDKTIGLEVNYLHALSDNYSE